MEMFLVSSNKGKLREFEQILNEENLSEIEIKNIELELEEIQAVEIEEVIKPKAKKAFQKINKPVIVEDTGLFIEELNGLPGALTKLFLERIGNEGICNLITNNRKAMAKTIITYFDGKDYNFFEGKISGCITKCPTTSEGFGWDPIFIPENYENTFAELSPSQKNKISMRKIALEKFKNFIKNSP